MAVSGKRLEKNTRTAIGITTNLCEACLNGNVTTVAKGVCKECKEYMCNTCFQHHLKARQCRHHVLVDIGSTLVLEKDETCKQHANEIIKYYCRSHERVGCGDCMVLEHSECKTDFIEKFSRIFTENKDFKDMIQLLENLSSAVKYHEMKVNTDKKNLEALHDKALKDIRGFKEKITKLCDEAEANIIAEVDDLKSEYDELLVKIEKDLKMISYQIDRVKLQRNTEIVRGNAVFARFTQSKPAITEMKQKLEHITLIHNLNRFEFKPNERLIDFLTTNENFGSIAVGVSCSNELENCVDHADVEETKQDEDETGPICIGARVRPLPDCTLGISSHNKEPGTIEHVECGGIITVKWDYSGQVKYGYRIGKSKCGNGIELI